MLKKLRQRLTVIFMLLTALVLSLAIGFAGNMAYNQQVESNQSLLQTTFSAIQDRFESSNEVSDAWLSKQEQENACLLYVEDNGQALAFSDVHTAETPLQQQGAAVFYSARQQGKTFSGEPYSFTVTDERGCLYNGIAVFLPADRNTDDGVLLMLLQDNTATAQQLRKLVLSYIFVWALAVIALGIISWFLVGMALQPTRKALQQQNEFVAAASHELRSPLTVIKTSLEAAQNSNVDHTEQRRFLTIAQSEAERMRRLTVDLLLLAGQDANVWHSDLAPLELDTLCIELYEAYRLPAQQKGHALTLRLPEQRFPKVEGDKQRLDQLFSILLNNAMEYAPAGTAIEIAAEITSHTVSVSVIDHGKGIRDENKAAVFRRFMRGDKSRSDKAHFGLGLSVAKEIADIHRAQILVSDTYGGGATFTVAFQRK